MAFRILYIDNGDVVAETTSYDAALTRLRAFLEEHPHLDDEIGIQEYDTDGKPLGALVVGVDVVGQQLAF